MFMVCANLIVSTHKKTALRIARCINMRKNRKKGIYLFCLAKCSDCFERPNLFASLLIIDLPFLIF